MLALTDVTCAEDTETVILGGFAPVKRRLEPAGLAFHDWYEKPRIALRRPKNREKNEANGTDPSAAEKSWKKKKRTLGEKRRHLSIDATLEGENLYKLLEAVEGSSTEEIRKNYRKLALVHHPDKQGGPEDVQNRVEKNEKNSLHFRKVQAAYEILCDTPRRRQYDSTLDFDDEIPESVDEKLGFFGTFEPVFARNARWSERRPVPQLGDDSTNLKLVHQFYNFWFEFDSWRDFSLEEQYNMEDAESRDERRFMDRQNQRIRKKHEEAERRRLRQLAEAARDLDPRILREKAEVEG